MKKTSSLLIAALGMLLGTYAKAQLDVLVKDVSLEYPGAHWVTLNINAGGPPSVNVTETVIPTPFLINGQESKSLDWYCMDPLQRIYYGGNSLTSTIHYASSDPSDFDKWTALAPGLSTPRLQDLADLFRAYWLPVSTSLNSAALQLAIWEITNEFDPTYDLLNGHFKAYANAGYNNLAEINLAKDMLAALGTSAVHNKGSIGAMTFLIDGTLNNDKSAYVQDLVGYDPTSRFLIPVPEPSTYGLGAILGLGLITAVRRRRRARA